MRVPTDKEIEEAKEYLRQRLGLFYRNLSAACIIASSRPIARIAR